MPSKTITMSNESWDRFRVATLKRFDYQPTVWEPDADGVPQEIPNPESESAFVFRMVKTTLRGWVREHESQENSAAFIGAYVETDLEITD